MRDLNDPEGRKKEITKFCENEQMKYVDILEE